MELFSNLKSILSPTTPETPKPEKVPVPSELSHPELKSQDDLHALVAAIRAASGSSKSKDEEDDEPDESESFKRIKALINA